MKKRHTTFYVNEVSQIDFCGKTIWQMDLKGAYEIPFETEPTSGKEHDFKTCENCQEHLLELTKRLTEKFNGDKQKPGFPMCCTHHSKLLKLKEFSRESFFPVPELVAMKIIYTINHIKNNYNTTEYYKDITDYIDYTVESFGKMPNDHGEPLFLGDYLFYVNDLIEKQDYIPLDIKRRLSEFLNSYLAPNKTVITDINILLSTYQKWLKIFPFEISFFANLRSHFEKKLPLLQGKPEVNRYTGIAKSKIHTKSSLVNVLVNITNSLLTQINSYSLYEKGLLSKPQKIKLELVLHERKMKLKQGYVNNSQNEEQRYRNILKEWFADEKIFIDEITPILKVLPPQSIQTNENRTKQLINQYIEGIDKQGWKYAFNTETDYNTFTDLLTNYFEYKEYTIPDTVIRLKRTCKTKLAKALGEIHKELSEKPLKSDNKYFEIVCKLSHFENEPDLYKALTR